MPARYAPAIINPTTKLPFAGNQISPTQFNPIGAAILAKLFASPNASGSRNYVANADISEDLHVGNFRVDWNKSDRNAFFGRFQNYWDTKVDPSGATKCVRIFWIIRLRQRCIIR